MRRGTGRLRRAGRAVLAVAVAAVVLAGVAANPAAAAPATRHLVAFATEDAAGAARARLERLGVPVEPAGITGLAVTAALPTVRALAGVVHVGVDHVMRAAEVPNDPCFEGPCNPADQSDLDLIGAPRAWNVAKGDGVTIAVLDSGVDFSHPDLAAKNAGFLDYTDEGPTPGTHGTKVGGIAAAVTNNGVGIAGVGWNSPILSIKVLRDDDGAGYESWVASGIDEAVRRGARVINLSLAAFEHEPTVLGAAVARAVKARVVVVAAAGNQQGAEPLTRPTYPASLPGVVAVAASDNNTLASFSHRGSWVDIAAPGVGLMTTEPGGGYKDATGTSASAPVVAGAAALLLQQGIDTTGDDIAARLHRTGVQVESGGLRRVQLDDALAGGFPYTPAWTGGARVARGDLLPDPGDEVVVVAGPGGGPHVRVYRDDGTPYGGGFMAYDPKFNLGLDVAVGDVDGDGFDEIITGVNPGGGPHVRVFEADGTPHGPGFMAYDQRFTGGVRVAVGNVDAGNPGLEIITGAGPGGGPHIAIFTPSGSLRGGFFAYAPAMNAGIQVAAGDVIAGGLDEIVSGAGPGGGPHVKVFNSAGGSPHDGFFAYNPAFTGGVDVAVGNVRSSSGDEIVTGPGPGGGPHVQVFRSDGFNLVGFMALDPGVSAGLAVGASDAGYVAATLGSPSVFRFIPKSA